MIRSLVRLSILKLMRRQNNGQSGYIGIQLHAHQTINHCARDKFVTINATIDDQPAGDDPRVLTTAGKNFGAQWNLESAGHFEQIDITIIQFGVCAQKRVTKLIDNVAVPA